MEICIETQNLNKHFGSIHAVQDLNLTVSVGARFGFLGPNGAGKTTTVRMLSGLMTPSSGKASVCDLDIYNQRDEIKAVTGLLPETPGIYSKLSAVEFLEFIGALNNRSGNELRRQINTLLSLLGLENRQNDLLETYSSGMKQKVLVASTLIHKPKLAFLDEPTSRLDPAAAALVKALILVLAKETSTSFFICTHQTAFAEAVCDKIGILVKGQLVIVGSPQDIIEKTNTQNLEEAYLKIVGGRIKPIELLTWRK
jgi:ABC-2 type transport system ATP-binding protein